MNSLLGRLKLNRPSRYRRYLEKAQLFFSNKRPWKFLLLSLVSIILLCYIVVSLPPSFRFSFFSYKVSVLFVFFPLLFSFLFSLVVFFFNTKNHALLGAAFIVVSLMLLVNKLTHPFFFIMLAALVLVLELFLYSLQKKPKG